jgi:hypothetical protein
MNMREFWQNEANIIKDKSVILDKQVLTSKDNDPTLKKFESLLSTTLTERFKSCKYYETYVKLGENPIYHKFLAPFIGTNKVDYQLDFVELGSVRNPFKPNGRAVVAYTERFSTTKNVYTDFQDPSASNVHITILASYKSELLRAGALLHESIHAYYRSIGGVLEKKVQELSLDHHEYMATNHISDIKQGLEIYSIQHELNFDVADINAVAWTGLTDTIAFTSNKDKDKILKRLQEIDETALKK